jgi:hypothetical protein
MADAIDQSGLAPDRNASVWYSALANAARATRPPLRFGMRLWAATCLALYITFWLELDNGFLGWCVGHNAVSRR